METKHMRKSWNRFARFQSRMLREEGQDLTEYAMVFALIAFATTAAMQTLAGDVGTVFTSIGAVLTNATS
jgi:pilus assembly protein Flp/PilA